MKRAALIFTSALLLSGLTCFATDKTVQPAAKEKNTADPQLKARAANYMQQYQALRFLENKGQMTDASGHAVPFVLFKAETAGMNLYITGKGLTYVFLEPEEEEEKEKGPHKENGISARIKDEKITWHWERVDLEIKGASIQRENIRKEGEDKTNFNFFYPHCPDGIYEAHEFERITVRNVYPRIDWVIYSGKEKGLKYEFIVHPGADYGQIELLYKSKNPVKINKGGELEVHTTYGEMKEHAPESFYEEKKIETKFTEKYNKRITINGDPGYESSILFSLSDFTQGDKDLVIDPQLWWATFYGGSTADGPMSITNDASGNVFITGYTLAGSTDFPVQDAGTYFQGTNAGKDKAFILKFDNSGKRLWATYYGGSDGDDAASSIAVDGNGNVFVTGATSSTDFPVQNAGTYFQGTNAGGLADAFILKFDNSGNRLWATYYGGSNFELGNSIAVDGNGNVFVTGATPSTDFPVQNAGAFFQGTNAGLADAFILKFDNSGNRLWATYYGGSDSEFGYSITVDKNGNVFVTGGTYSTDFPVQNAGTFFQGAYAGGVTDVFILKFDNSGKRLWATYYGGSDDEEGYSIAVDRTGNVFVTGFTSSTDLPVQDAGAFFQGKKGGGIDVDILEFDNSGNRVWATYIGGIKDDNCESNDNIAFDTCGNVFVSFTTYSPSLPCQASCNGGYFDNTFNGGSDVFLALFSKTRKLLWSSYVGGQENDFREAMTVDRNNNLFVSGEWAVTSATSYPVTDPGAGAYYSSVSSGSDDGYILKFLMDACQCIQCGLTASATSTIANCSVNNGTATAVPSGGTAPLTYAWSSMPVQTTQTATGLGAGNYTVTVTDSMGCTSTQTVTITQTTNPTATATSIISPGGSATLIATGGGTYLWVPATGLSNPNISNPVASPLQTTQYCVYVTNAAGCSDSACIRVEYECKDIFVPTAFSPNNDGMNEMECVLGNCIKELKFVIYDRWGEKVFETSDPKLCWDGTYKGKPLNTAVFVYYLKVLFTDGREVERKGNISLIR